MSQRLRLHPGLVFISLVGALAFGSALFALIIIPLLATSVVIGRYLHRRMLNLDPWTPNMGQPLSSSIAELDGETL